MRGRLNLEAELPYLTRFARMICNGNRAEADDLVQETLLKAIRSADQFRGNAKVSTWLTKIMINTHTSHLRKVKQRGEMSDIADAPEPSRPADQETIIEARQTLAALATLPEDQRVPIAMLAAGDVSYAEVAEALDVPIGTVMSRVSRGRAALRAKVDGQSGKDGQ